MTTHLAIFIWAVFDVFLLDVLSQYWVQHISPVAFPQESASLTIERENV